MAEGGFTIESQFLLFSLFNCEKSDGTTITLRQIDKWFQQAEILDGKIVTHTDTGVLFNKFKSRTIPFEKFLLFLEDLAFEKQLDIDDLLKKLTECGIPGTDKKKQTNA